VLQNTVREDQQTNYYRIASRLIESLARVIDANDGKPYTTPVWLSSTRSPQLRVVKTILNVLRDKLSRKRPQNRPDQAARARTVRAEGKQAQVEEGDDEDPAVVNDDNDPIVVVDDDDPIVVIDD
jgi:hypothetical protein